MKKKSNLQLSMLYGIVILTALTAFAACPHQPDPPKTYTITIEYDANTGTATASPNPAAKGKMVTITAEPGSNYKFKAWELVSGGITLDPYTSPTTFTMPGNAVTIKAEFEALADVTFDDFVYGYDLTARRSIGITNLGINTQSVSDIAFAGGAASPFVLDETDIKNKITSGNVAAFFVLLKEGLNAGTYTDTVIITHGGGKTSEFELHITVNPKPLTISGIVADSREYDGTTTATFTGTPALEGLIAGDDVLLSGAGTADFENKDVGTGKAIVFSDFILSGEDADNYIFSQPEEIKADILPKSVILTITYSPSSILVPFGTTTVSYLYDTYRQNDTVNFTITGFIPGEDVTVIVSENNYGLFGSTENGTMGIITVYYNGAELDQTTPVQAYLDVTGNYRLASANNPFFDVYIIDGLTDVRMIPIAMANIEEFKEYVVTTNGLKRHYKLAENINLTKPPTGGSNWTAIGASAAGFSGGFNGNGFVIQNLTINRLNNNQGLFGVVSSGGIVQNIALINADITGSDNTGGIAGENNGTIHTSYITGSVKGGLYIGGLTGINNGVIENSYSTSSVTGTDFVGGIAGNVNGTVQYCYSTGNIKGVDRIGGIAGNVNNGAEVKNCAALNNRVTSEAVSTVNLGRVAGFTYNAGLLVNNYGRGDTVIKRTVSNTGQNIIDGETVYFADYKSTDLWLNFIWDVTIWNFTTVWQMNVNNLPRLRTAGGSQSHDLEFPYDMVYIPAGSFEMGSPSDEDGRKPDESPVHTVNLSGFYIGSYEVNELQYSLVMGTLLDYKSDGFPKIDISWYEALVFCNRLSMKENLSPAYGINNSTDPQYWGVVPISSDPDWDVVEIVEGSNGYRLSTEAQWEYACRAGTNTAYASGDILDDDMCWYRNTTQSNFKEVGITAPNDWGLYDMHGNVNEWCWDWYGPYTSNPQTDPLGSYYGTNRVLRGGNGRSQEEDVRSAARYDSSPYDKNIYLGLRLVRP